MSDDARVLLRQIVLRLSPLMEVEGGDVLRCRFCWRRRTLIEQTSSPLPFQHDASCVWERAEKLVTGPS